VSRSFWARYCFERFGILMTTFLEKFPRLEDGEGSELRKND
jgi:hypothetical protein